MGSAPKRVIFKIIDEMRNYSSLKTLRHFSGLPKSGYYKWRVASQRADSEAKITTHIKAIHSMRPFYGYRRSRWPYAVEGFTVNHKRVYRLMHKLGIQSVIRKKRRYFGKSGSIVFPNLLGRNFKVQLPNKKLVTDITYLPTTSGFIYLSVVQDLCNNEVVAHAISPRNDLALVLATLDKLTAMPGAVVNSDQGFQYTHKLYHNQLEKLQLQGSHSRKGNCLDNACVESFFSHLKAEVFLGKSVQSKDETSTQVEEYIRFYNTERFQKRLGQLSPVECREKLAA